MKRLWYKPLLGALILVGIAAIAHQRAVSVQRPTIMCADDDGMGNPAARMKGRG
jgi:hypothetical protein